MERMGKGSGRGSMKGRKNPEAAIRMNFLHQVLGVVEVVVDVMVEVIVVMMVVRTICGH